MRTVYSPEHRLHHPRQELSDGRLVAAVEVPARAEMAFEAVTAAGIGAVVEPEPVSPALLARVHAPGYLEFLEGFWGRWRAAGRAYDALPLAWPVPGLRRILPRDIDGQLSYYSFDAGTPLTPGTWQAALAGASVAATAAKLIAEGDGAAFALCRPPGHHAAADYFGGYCFLNNAAIAAECLLDRGAARVAILDLDYHHGNGTQSIFYDRGEVLFVSLHADPRDEYPFFLGHRDETGVGAGAGCNVNLPLPLGTDYAAYKAAFGQAAARIAGSGAEALVVSLGLDTYEGDPISKFRLKSEDYLDLGGRLAGLRLPTLIVFEGGYAIDALGANLVNVLTGFENR